MKFFAPLITICLFLVISSPIQAQKKGQLSAKPPAIEQTKGAKVKFCQLKMYVSPDGKTNIVVDFGDTDNMDEKHLREIKLEGYSRDFNNMVDALRFMSKRNWRLGKSYEIQEGKSKVIYFIMTRK